MTINQVQLSNTFNEFRQTVNESTNTVNSFTDGTGTTFNTNTGIANTLTVLVNASVANLSATGTGTVAGNFSVNGDRLTVNASTGATAVKGNLAVGTNKANIIASNGDFISTGNVHLTGATSSIDAYDLHASDHVGVGGELSVWVAAKGDTQSTHRLYAIANTNGPQDVLVVNQSDGANAYSEFIAIHHSGNTDQGWVSVGINSTNYAEGAYGITKADDAYLLYQAPEGTTESGDLVIGTGSNGTGNRIIFAANGFDDPANNTQLIIDPGNFVHIEIDTESSNTTTGALIVAGGIGLTGNLNVGGNVAITGTITLGGGGNTVSTDSLSVDNPILYLGANNAADVLDLGVVGYYNDGTTKYAGLVRDASDNGIIKFFANTTVLPTSTVDFSNANLVYPSVKVGAIEANNTTASSSTSTGAIVSKGGLGVAGAMNVGGAVQLSSSSTVEGLATFTGGLRAQEIVEDVIDVTQTSNATTLDYSTGTVFYRTSTNFSANFTVNITNAPTDDGRVFSITLFQTQGATGYRPTTLNINGSGATIKWSDASAPTPTSTNGAVDVFSFTVIRRSGAYEVLATSSLNFA